MNETRVPRSDCARCNKKLDTASPANGEPITPRAGDLSICSRCGMVSIYDADLRLRRMTKEETEAFATTTPDLARRIRFASNLIYTEYSRKQSELN